MMAQHVAQFVADTLSRADQCMCNVCTTFQTALDKVRVKQMCRYLGRMMARRADQFRATVQTELAKEGV